ncbi:MAG: NAD(+)--dinitrogen-reductase ADP-D-ribosyltransferase [Rivihabitans pingtungensis]
MQSAGGDSGQPHLRDAPMPLKLDGVAKLHADLFRRLDAQAPAQQAEIFPDYMTVHFPAESPGRRQLYNATRGGRRGALYIQCAARLEHQRRQPRRRRAERLEWNHALA